MKKYVIFLLFVISSSGYSQNSININKHFSLRFIEENIIVERNKIDNSIIKEPELLFIEVDSLDCYLADIIFYRFKLGENFIKINNDNIEISFNSTSCNEYILAYNLNNAISYRLKGFNGNDLFFLLRDIKQVSNNKTKYRKILKSLDNLNIGVNFSSIYKSLRNLEFDSECLKVCSDGVILDDKLRKK